MNRIAAVTSRLALALAVPALLLASGAVHAAEPERGRALYESRCSGCHTESVHGRAKREARDFESIRGWVRRWNHQLKLRWDAGEVDDVAAYLNFTYYRYPCPVSICKAVSLNR